MSDAAFWDRAAARYSKRPIGNVPAYEATLARVRDYLAPGDRVLETGCGTGTTALKLADSVAHYTAADVSSEMIAIARQKAAASGPATLDFAVAAADEDQFAPDSFDAVLGFNLLHLVPDLDAALARAWSLLKPGGLYITKTPCIRNMTPLLRLILPVLRLVGKAPAVQVFARDELEDRIRAAGFEIVEARSFDRAPSVWFVVARKT